MDEHDDAYAGLPEDRDEGLRWARSVLADPVEASIQASGMDVEEIDALREAFG